MKPVGVDTDSTGIQRRPRPVKNGPFQADELGEWAFEVTGGGASQREVALRMAINLVMYASCLDYKADMLHLPFLMKRRR